MAGKDLRRKLGMMLAGAKSIPPASAYIQDGLVLHMDGIEKGSTPNAWTSLVGGYKFTAYDSPVFNANNIQFDGSSRFMNDDFLAPESDTGTIEIVYNGLTQNSALFASRNDVARLCFFLYNNNRLVWSSKTSHPRYINIPSVGSVSVSGMGCFANGEQKTSSGGDNLSTTSTMMTRIGCRYSSSSNNSFYEGKIYSIRIYNRQLTEAEVLQNLAVDRARFGIGYPTE